MSGPDQTQLGAHAAASLAGNADGAIAGVSPRVAEGGVGGAEFAASRELRLTGLSGRVVPAVVEAGGHGLPVVFLHGLIGLNEHWEGVAAGLMDLCRCTRLELRLHGLSGADCSVEGVVALLINYLERFEGEPVALVGNSFGGHCALRVAIDRPELVRALILSGSAGLLERSFDHPPALRPQRSWLAERVREIFFDPCLASEAEVDRAFEALRDRSASRAIVKLSRSARRDHLGDRISRIAVPTLLIWGRDDVVTPPSAAEAFHELIPDSRIEWIDRCGHAPMIEHPQRFVEATRRFVSELEAAGDAGGSA